ncbi:MAG: ATP synthase F1 subunit delta [Bdellovibrionales bacterium]|nr:ATP synthase F1 subunit delta [Bdellovibrionales bacterium]
MRFSELASRYAKAIYEIAEVASEQDKVFAELRELDKVYGEPDIVEYLSSPLIAPDEKLKVVKDSIKDKGLSETTENFVLTLARKGRLNIFSQIVHAYQSKSDEAMGVRRGTVTSASVLPPEERKEIEKTVEKVTGKKVILAYEEDTELIGGLIAKVGSYTFDDTLTSHLRRLQEDIKRRAH